MRRLEHRLLAGSWLLACRLRCCPWPPQPLPDAAADRDAPARAVRPAIGKKARNASPSGRPGAATTATATASPTPRRRGRTAHRHVDARVAARGRRRCRREALVGHRPRLARHSSSTTWRSTCAMQALRRLAQHARWCRAGGFQSLLADLLQVSPVSQRGRGASRCWRAWPPTRRGSTRRSCACARAWRLGWVLAAAGARTRAGSRSTASLPADVDQSRRSLRPSGAWAAASQPPSRKRCARRRGK